jgi:hypothetical protein
VCVQVLYIESLQISLGFAKLLADERDPKAGIRIFSKKKKKIVLARSHERLKQASSVELRGKKCHGNACHVRRIIYQLHLSD